MLIGITGGVASGKSRVAQTLGRYLEAVVLSADEICREQLMVGSLGYTRFLASAGSEFLTPDNEIDRKKLREALFNDEALRIKLEAILHPLVRARIQETAHNHQKSFVVAEVPLLFESGWQDDFDYIITVSADRVTRLKRVIDRDRVSSEQAMKIMSAQMQEQQKNELADYVIINDGGWKRTEKQVMKLASLLKKKNKC